MKIEDQVCSLQFARKLKELGVYQQSAFTWEFVTDYSITKGIAFNSYLKYGRREFSKASVYENVSAFTVAELGAMLPTKTENWQTAQYEDGRWFITNHQNTLRAAEADTEADARAKMLIYLIESGILGAEGCG